MPVRASRKPAPMAQAWDWAVLRSGYHLPARGPATSRYSVMPRQWHEAHVVPVTRGTARNKKGGVLARLFRFCVSRFARGSARVEFDDQVRFHLHRIGHFIQRGDADEGGLVGLGGDVIRDIALGQALRFGAQGPLLCPLAE